MKGKNDMRTVFFLTFMLALLPSTMLAQDDMYFTPTKEDVKKAKKEREKQQQELNARTGIGTYYSGLNKTDDEYNRRVRRSNQTKVTHIPIGESGFSADSVASDIIQFQTSNNYADTLKTDTVYKYVFLDDDDFWYTRNLSRYYDFYWWGYHPWHYGRPIGWYTGWYGPYGPWYDPWFDPWYDPWFAYRYYGFYDAWFYAWYGPYDPYFYHRNWYSGYYGWGYVPSGGRPGYSGGGSGYSNFNPRGSVNHIGSRVRDKGHFADRIGISSSGSNTVARRNGDVINAYTGRATGPVRFAGDRYSGNENSRSYNYDAPSNHSSSFGGSRSSYSGGGGSFSSGGSSSGGGARSSGGGHFGGGRR